MTKIDPKFKFSEYFGAWRNPFQNAKKKLFLAKVIRELQQWFSE